MYDSFGDDIYIPLNKRLCRFVEETGEIEISEIDKHNKLKIFTFVNSEEQCEICKQAIDELNAWITRHSLMNYHQVVWVIEPEMSKNLICKDVGITISPSTLFCDINGNIKDIVTGRPAQTWLDKYMLPMVGVDGQ